MLSEKILLLSSNMQNYYRKRIKLLNKLNHPLDLVFWEDVLKADVFYSLHIISDIEYGYDHRRVIVENVKFTNKDIIGLSNIDDNYHVKIMYPRHNYPVIGITHTKGKPYIEDIIHLISPKPFSDNDILLLSKEINLVFPGLHIEIEKSKAIK